MENRPDIPVVKITLEAEGSAYVTPVSNMQHLSWLFDGRP